MQDKTANCKVRILFKKMVLEGLSEAFHVSIEWLKGKTDEYETDNTDKKELQIRDAMGDILNQLPLDLNNLEEQCLTIRRSIRYDGSRHKNIIGPTKRKKVRIVYFGDTLTEILCNARKERLKNRMQYGELYHKNYYREVKGKNRVYYEFYHLDGTEEIPDDYQEISFVCLRQDGSLELPSTLGIVCRKIAEKPEGFEGFHFHQLRHPYVKPTTKNIYLYTRFRFENASRSLAFSGLLALSLI